MGKLPDDKKLGELMLYIACKSLNDPKFGATKLNKLLFYSEFAVYRDFGDSITGHEYVRRQNGPAPRRFLPVRNRLLQTQQAKLERVEFMGKYQERLVNLRLPDLSQFHAEEIDTVDQVIEHFKDFDGTEISEHSHQFIGWKLAEDGEVIPYEVALVETRRLSDAEREYGRSLQPAAIKALRGTPQYA